MGDVLCVKFYVHSKELCATKSVVERVDEWTAKYWCMYYLLEYLVDVHEDDPLA